MQRYCGQLQKHVRVEGFCWSYGKLPEKATGKLDADIISSWSYDMESHAKKCVERYCELANKATQQVFKVATPCMDDHQFKEEEFGSVGELIVHSLLTNCSEHVNTWPVLVDLICHGQ